MIPPASRRSDDRATWRRAAAFGRSAMLSTLALALLMAPAHSQAPATPAAPATPPAATAPEPAPNPPAAAPAPAAPAAPAQASPPASPPTPPAAQAPTSPPPAVQTADPFGEDLTLAGKTVLLQRGLAKWDSAFDTITETLTALFGAIEKQGAKPAGSALVVYTSTDDAGFSFEAQIPLEQALKTLPKGMSMGKSPEGKALKFVHRGSYDNMDNTYEAITNHLDDKRLEAKDMFIEEYVTDPLKTAEDKLVINVYVPLK